jgi:hypothetical protein
MVRTCSLSLHQGAPYANEVSSAPSLLRDPQAAYRRTTTAQKRVLSLSIAPIMIPFTFTFTFPALMITAVVLASSSSKHAAGSCASSGGTPLLASQAKQNPSRPVTWCPLPAPALAPRAQQLSDRDRKHLLFVLLRPCCEHDSPPSFARTATTTVKK